jgi:hypothetical protein
MKINWAYLKKPSVIIGAVILFFVLLFMLNRGGAKAASQTVVNQGPTDAQVTAQTQLAIAQIGAGLQGQALQLDFAKSQDANATQLAEAQIAATLSGQSLQVQRDIATQTVAAQVHGLDLQYQTAVANNQFALNYAQQQYNYGIATTAINANLQAHIVDTSASLQEHLADVSAYSANFQTVVNAFQNNHYAETVELSQMAQSIPTPSNNNITTVGVLH